MKFEKIQIRNFRNFEDVKIDLSNKNIFFGLNDVGLSGIREFEDKLTPEYQKFRDEGISVSIKSEIAVKGFCY